MILLRLPERWRRREPAFPTASLSLSLGLGSQKCSALCKDGCLLSRIGGVSDFSLGGTGSFCSVTLFAAPTQEFASLTFPTCSFSHPTQAPPASSFMTFPKPRVAFLLLCLSSEHLFIPQNSTQALILPKLLLPHRSELIPCTRFDSFQGFQSVVPRPEE